ncbi:MAG: DoxX family membrane protein [Planctomycetota bacterium]|jgi:uncharacterized membrane protein YphA (DoxX/SURF4 family)
MQRWSLLARVLLGLVYFVLGANGFLDFIPKPDGTSASRALGDAFDESGYMWSLIEGTEVVGGLLLLTGVATPLGLVVLAPITVNVLLWNLLLDPSGMPIGIAVTLLHLYLGWSYRDDFRSLFRIG